jgi:tetratricopeptide (TPR) repeat protein/capsular polysaccharide biosynthesis protein
LYQQGDLVGAASSYRQAIALRKNYADAHHNLATVLTEQGQWSAALQHYQRAIALQPDWSTAQINLGVLFLKQGDFASAVQVYQPAIAQAPDSTILYIYLAQAQFGLGQIEAAIAAYRRAIELEPTLAIAHHNLGKVWQHQGQHQAALDCFQQALSFDPALTDAYSDCAVSWMALGKVDAAIACLQRAIATDHNWITAYLNRYSPLIQDAELSDELSRVRIALHQFLKALLDYHPRLTEFWAEVCLGWGNLLTAYGGHNSYRQAEAFYQRALQLQPQWLNIYLALAHCLAQQKRFNAAILLCHLAQARFPNPADIPLQLGSIFEQQGNLARAIACYRQAMQTVGKDKGERMKDKTNHCSPSSFPLHPSSFPLHPSSFILHPSSFILPPSPFPSPPPCAGLNCSLCLKRLFKDFDPIHLGNGLHYLSRQSVVSVETVPLSVAAVPAGRVWAVPQQNDWMVCHAIAIFNSDHHLLPNLSREYPGQLPGCQQSEPIFQRLPDPHTLPDPEPFEGTVAVLTGLSGHVYFHWMVDILPRVELLHQQGIDLAQIDWFLINSQRRPFQQESLKVLGIPADNVIESDRHPYIQADQILVPSFPGSLGWAQPWAIDFLRRTFLSAQPNPTQTEYPTHLYISRATARYRRVLNEPEVIDQLKQWGFVCLCLEKLAIAEQVAYFNHAQVIIAPHGSGLTNLAFCQPGTKIIELVSPHYLRPYYWVISNQLGLEHYFLAGQSLTCHPIRELIYPNPLTEDIWVDVKALEGVGVRG